DLAFNPSRSTGGGTADQHQNGQTNEPKNACLEHRERPQRMTRLGRRKAAAGERNPLNANFPRVGTYPWEVEGRFLTRITDQEALLRPVSAQRQAVGRINGLTPSWGGDSLRHAADAAVTHADHDAAGSEGLQAQRIALFDGWLLLEEHGIGPRIVRQ